MHDMSRRIAILAAIITVAAAIGVAAPAALASGCSGSACVGHDPVTYGCSATSTKSATAFLNGVAVATVWNRYSLGCNANWARAQLTQAGINQHLTIQVKVWITATYQTMCFPGPSNTGSWQEICDPLPGYGGSAIVYTDMVDGSYKTYAGVDVYAGSNDVTSAVSPQ